MLGGQRRTLACFLASFLACSWARICCFLNSNSLISCSLKGQSEGMPGSLGCRGFLPSLAFFRSSLAFFLWCCASGAVLSC